MFRPVVALRLAATLLLLVAGPGASLGAQSKKTKGDEAPPRPRFTIARDSNSAAAYYYHGLQVLGKKPYEAADAFYWAARLDPQWADPIYARRVALLMKYETSLVSYVMS